MFCSLFTYYIFHISKTAVLQMLKYLIFKYLNLIFKYLILVLILNIGAQFDILYICVWGVTASWKSRSRHAT